MTAGFENEERLEKALEEAERALEGVLNSETWRSGCSVLENQNATFALAAIRKAREGK